MTQLEDLKRGSLVKGIAEEVVQHLAARTGDRLEVTFEVQSVISDRTPDDVVRTVSENCRTLKFTSHGFEKE